MNNTFIVVGGGTLAAAILLILGNQNITLAGGVALGGVFCYVLNKIDGVKNEQT